MANLIPFAAHGNPTKNPMNSSTMLSVQKREKVRIGVRDGVGLEEHNKRLEKELKNSEAKGSLICHEKNSRGEAP